MILAAADVVGKLDVSNWYGKPSDLVNEYYPVGGQKGDRPTLANVRLCFASVILKAREVGITLPILDAGTWSKAVSSALAMQAAAVEDGEANGYDAATSLVWEAFEAEHDYKCKGQLDSEDAAASTALITVQGTGIYHVARGENNIGGRHLQGICGARDSQMVGAAPGAPTCPECLKFVGLKIKIGTHGWRQIGGDLNPGAHGGTIAKCDGSSIEIREIQPIRDSVGDSEAVAVGHPFWTKEGYFDLSDLNVGARDVASALSYVGLDADGLADIPTPELRGMAIAEALLSYGRGDEGTAGWAADVITEPVLWSGSTNARGWRFLASEDVEFRQMVREAR